MNGLFPGWPGPAFNGRTSNVALPSLPGVPLQPNGQPSAGPAPSPLNGLAAYGVPIAQTPSGQLFVQSNMDPSGFRPPNIPGMPQMPGPPDWFLGGNPGGGLFQPMLPVAPFDQGNQVGPMQQQSYGGA